MNWFDFVILGVILASTLNSLRQGFILELTYFFSFVIGFLVSILAYPWATRTANGILGSGSVPPMVSFLLLFVFAGGTVALLGMLFHEFLQFIKLGGLDRLAGAALGCLKAVVGVGVALVLITGMSGSTPPAFLDNSALSRPFTRTTVDSMKSVPTLFNAFVEDFSNPSYLGREDSSDENTEPSP